MLKNAKGEHVNDVTIDLCRSMPTDPAGFCYLKMTFSDVFMRSYSFSSADSDDRPTEEVTFTYTKLQLEYIPQTDPENPVEGGFDVSKGKKA
jgi:type VI protein secretion system component Hcp